MEVLGLLLRALLLASFLSKEPRSCWLVWD